MSENQGHLIKYGSKIFQAWRNKGLVVFRDAGRRDPQSSVLVKGVSIMAYPYDVAISFAGEDRGFASALAHALKERHGLLVFYDEDEQAWLMGKNLFEYLIEIYKDKAAYCLILVSEHYREKRWSRHEWKAVQARAFEEPDRDYILPVRLDDAELPGLLPTLGFIDGRRIGPEKVAELVAAKVRDAAFINERIRDASHRYAKNDFEGALAALVHPEVENHIDALRIKADTYGNLGQYGKAINCLQQIIKELSEDFLSHFLLGIFYFRLGNFEPSVHHYEIAERLAPGHPTIATDLPFARKLGKLVKIPIVGRYIRSRIISLKAK